MLYASADQQVLGYLGRALSLEMTAVQQYATQAKLVSAWGLTADARKLQAESLEEMGHADAELERDLVELYTQATRHCARKGDHNNRNFFEGLLQEEQAHDIALAEWLKNLESPETSPSARVTF